MDFTNIGGTNLAKVTASGGITNTGYHTLTALATPTAPTFTTAATGGTLLASTTYYYRIVAVSGTGVTLGSTEASLATAAGTATNTLALTWAAVTGAESYKVYGRTTGAELLIASGLTALTYTDTGSVTPAGALPTVNTTGYVNSALYQANGVSGVTATLADGSAVTGGIVTGVPTTILGNGSQVTVGGTIDTATRLSVKPVATSENGLTVTMPSGATGNALTVKSSAGTILWSVNAAGTASSGAGATSPSASNLGLMSVSSGYQTAVGAATFSPAFLVTDRTTGDSTTGYNGFLVSMMKPSTIVYQSANALASGIIGAWPVSEATGTTVRDIGPNSLNLSFYGSPTWATGPNGAILNCTPTNGLTIADNALLKPASGFTVSGYVYVGVQSGGYARMLQKLGSSGGYYTIAASNSYQYTTGSAYGNVCPIGTTYQSAYHLYTFTVNTTTNLMSLYIDGSLFITGSGSGSLAWDTSAQYIMGGPGSIGLIGSLDVIYEWNRALSATEVATLSSNPYQLIGVVTPVASLTALMDAGTLGSLPITTIKYTRTWSQQLSEVLEYSTNGTTWTAVTTGYTPVSNAGSAISLQTIVTLGSAINVRYLRYSAKDTGTGAQVLLTDFCVS